MTHDDGGDDTKRRHRRLRPASNAAVIAVLAFAGMCASFMQTILVPIQGELPVLLNASREDTAWVITITLLVSAIFTPISGRLGDMYGKRRVALTLIGLLILGSSVAAMSPGIVSVIIGRGLQGAGMGVIPLGISILRDVLPRKRLASAIALVSATLGVGAALGLPVSAYVSQNADWHMLFWVAAVLGAVAFVLMAWIVPPSTLRTGGKLDVVGLIGLAIGLTGVLVAISRGTEWGWASAPTLCVLLGGVLVLVVWGWYELRVSNPLVDLRVSVRGPVLVTNLASVAMGFAMFTSNIAFPQLLEQSTQSGGLGLTLLQSSLILMPAGFTMLAMSPVAGFIERRWGAKPLFVVGSMAIAIGYVLAVTVPVTHWMVLSVNLILGIGIGLGFAAMPTIIMQAVPVGETGAANGLNTLMRSLGTSSASTVIAVVLTGSAVEYDGVLLPSADGYQTAFVIGLGAAIVCAGLAVCIPKARAHPGERPSLPDRSD